jgi:hypothetical protein
LPAFASTAGGPGAAEEDEEEATAFAPTAGGPGAAEEDEEEAPGVILLVLILWYTKEHAAHVRYNVQYFL